MFSVDLTVTIRCVYVTVNLPYKERINNTATHSYDSFVNGYATLMASYLSYSYFYYLIIITRYNLFTEVEVTMSLWELAIKVRICFFECFWGF